MVTLELKEDEGLETGKRYVVLTSFRGNPIETKGYSSPLFSSGTVIEVTNYRQAKKWSVKLKKMSVQHTLTFKAVELTEDEKVHNHAEGKRFVLTVNDDSLKKFFKKTVDSKGILKGMLEGIEQ